MKVRLLMLIGIVVIVAALGAFFFLRGGTRSGAENVATPPAASSIPARATTLAPDMTRRVASSMQVESVADSTAVYAGDTLTTSHDGRGLLEEANGTATVLDYDTTLTLTENDGSGTHTSSFLAAGAVWARVEKVFGKGEYYTIKTQNAVALVRGTSFGVSYRNGISTLLVASGTVVFMSVDKATGGPLESTGTLVSAGNKATIDSSGLVVSPLSAADQRAPWYLYNTRGFVEAPKGTPPPAISTTSVATPQITGVREEFVDPNSPTN